MRVIGSSGVISWTPREAQGPSTNVVSVSVTDNGVPALSATNSFTVTVTEVNLAPVLSVPADQTIDEQTTLSVSASATDADLPANTLIFALVSAPTDRKSTRLNSSHSQISYAVFCLKKKKKY